MFIESLTLVGYKRLLLNDIREFVYEPHSTVQLILGTNGSGKSSVLAELSPMPGDKNDFAKDGMKKIRLRKRGVTYILTSTFNPSPKHSFVEIIGDVEKEHNSGGTEKVQLNLIWEIFKIDNAIHELMRGADKFTLMGPGKRREWITRLSVADYDFAMGAYDKLRDRFECLKAH
jgi:hypothetical protein